MENACAGWLAGWQAGQRWLAGWLSWLCEVHFGWVFTRLSDANLLTVWLAAWLAAWLVECLYGYSILNVFSHGFPTQIGVVPMRFI